MNFKYTYEDLSNIETAFFDCLVHSKLSSPEIFFIGQGIKRYLETDLEDFLDSSSRAKISEFAMYVTAERHSYILSFVGKLISDLELLIRQTQSIYWYDEYKKWLGNLEYVRKELEAKRPI